MKYDEAWTRAGITYRQADHWRSRGWVKASIEGSGFISEISTTEARILTRMATLVTAGMKPQAAARIARATVEQGVRAADLPGGLRLIFDAQEPQPMPQKVSTP